MEQNLTWDQLVPTVNIQWEPGQVTRFKVLYQTNEHGNVLWLGPYPLFRFDIPDDIDRNSDASMQIWADRVLRNDLLENPVKNMQTLFRKNYINKYWRRLYTASLYLPNEIIYSVLKYII
jgi:hypothetical protein